MSFVGILSSESCVLMNFASYTSHSCSFFTSSDLPSPINVPTLHVVSSRSIPITILPRIFPDPSLVSSINTLREGLISWIADEGLAGDRIAAEWVLLCIIARVYVLAHVCTILFITHVVRRQSRVPPMYPLSLTISHFPSDSNERASPPALFHVLSQILPMVSVLPLSLNMLNDTSFYPESKDEDLHSGWLQHPKGSVIICTEGGVSEGSIIQKGIFLLCYIVKNLLQLMYERYHEYSISSGNDEGTGIRIRLSIQWLQVRNRRLFFINDTKQTKYLFQGKMFALHRVQKLTLW